MLNKQIRECLLGILVVCGLASGASAQRMLPLMDIEPGEFKADYQLFSPLQTDDFIDGFKANTGWFFTYDRTYFRTTRPDAEASFMQSDRTWGNRFDFGYMTSQGHGWYFSVLDLSGPNVSERVRQERNNRFVEGSPQEEPIDPPQDNNNRETGARDYFLNDTLNVATVSNFEINKTFRREPRSNGSIVEPFVGFRMGRFTDFYRSDEYNRYDDEGNPVPPIPDPNDPDSPAPDDAAIEEYISSNANLSNNMFGGQIGTRWYNKKGRWMLSGELKAFAMANLQHLEDRTFTTITLVDVGTDEDVNTETRQFITSYASANEFVVGGEIRAEAAYEVTRDFSLRFGFELLEFGKGIGRGNDIAQNTESATIYGITFGCTLNR